MDGVETRFSITKPGATLACYSLPFTLGTNETWNAPATVLQVFAGTSRFKEVLSSYGQWARANWWTHRPVPDDLRDRFISVPHWENNNGSWWGGRAESLQDNYRAHPAFEWAYWWDHDESIQVNGKPYMLTHGNYGFESNWGGAPAYAADVARCRSAGAATCLYLQARIVWKQSQVGLAHKTDWGWMDMPGRYNEDWTGTDFGYGHIGDMWSMCPQATGWHQYLAEACRAAVQGTGADGVRLDTASQYLVCHNPNHSHTETMDGVCAFLQTVRGGLDAVGPGKWLKVEHIGSDAAARYFDASLGQAYDAGSPNASLVSDAYGLVPFRFVFPEVKLFEWGDMWSDTNYHRASRRMLFNGVGTTKGCKASYYPELFHFTEVLRGMGDVLASTDCEPLVPTMVAGVLANRFSLNGREVYTLWNRSGADVSGPLLRIPGASGRRFMDMVAGRSLPTARDGGADVVSLTIPNDEVVVIGVFPQQVIQSIPGDLSQTFHVPGAPQLTLQVVDAATGEVLASDATAIVVDDAALAGGPLIVRAVKNGYLLQDCIEASPGIRNEYTPDANTVVLWHLNEQSGPTALDMATPTLDGANNGVILPNNTRAAGRFGGGLTASSGGTGHLSAPISGNLFADQQCAMDAWIRPTAIANDSAGASYVMGWTGPDTAQGFIRLYAGGQSASFGTRVKYSTTYQWAEVYVPDLGVNLLDGNWHHIAGTYHNGTLKLFVNGVEMGSATPYPGYSLLLPDTFYAAGGTPWEPASGRYIGGIDEVRLSNIARADFSAAPAPPPPAAEFPPDAATVLLWHLNEGSGANTFDVASPVLDGANNGAITPGATWTAGRFGGGLDAPASGTGYVSASLGADRFTTQATMEAWLLPADISEDGSYVMGWRGPGTEFSFVRLYQGGYSAGVGFRVTDGNSAYWAQADFNLPVNLLDGTWRHLAGTFHDGVVRIYLNGALMGAHDTGYGAGWTLMQPDTFIAAGGAALGPGRRRRASLHRRNRRNPPQQRRPHRFHCGSAATATHRPVRPRHPDRAALAHERGGRHKLGRCGSYGAGRSQQRHRHAERNLDDRAFRPGPEHGRRQHRIHIRDASPRPVRRAAGHHGCMDPADRNFTRRQLCDGLARTVNRSKLCPPVRRWQRGRGRFPGVFQQHLSLGAGRLQPAGQSAGWRLAPHRRDLPQRGDQPLSERSPDRFLRHRLWHRRLVAGPAGHVHRGRRRAMGPRLGTIYRRHRRGPAQQRGAHRFHDG